MEKADMRSPFITVITALFLGSSMHYAQAANGDVPVVLELFTSQSCSSCPPADALLKRIVENDPSVLALSYHVDYWDHLSWKDTYSSSVNTQRQRNYAQILGGGVFTPELVVGGAQSMVGSDESDVTRAVAQAKQMQPVFNVSITPKEKQLAVTIGLLDHTNNIQNADILEVRYDRYAQTQVKAGENGGRMLESINNVTSIKPLGSWTPKTMSLPLLIDLPSDSVAILVQAPNQGKILGAAFYNK